MTAYDKGVITHHVYDPLGRWIRSIRVQGTRHPADWLWNSSQWCWVDGAGSPSIMAQVLSATGSETRIMSWQAG